MKHIKLHLLILPVLLVFASCDMIDHVEKRVSILNHYEDKALDFSKQNRDLRYKISKLEDNIIDLQNQNHYLKVQLEERKGEVGSRGIASISPRMVSKKGDEVKFDVYKWTPSQVLAVAEKEFNSKNYTKSAQFFQAFKDHFPNHKKLNDQFLFQAGVASFESGKHYTWAIDSFDKLVRDYPTSKFYRGAKLWMALANLKTGNDDKFFGAVEEFRMKYRNTSEWKVLSKHYEKIVQKHKKN